MTHWLLIVGGLFTFGAFALLALALLVVNALDLYHDRSSS